MALLVTAWGARLTFNFARKGGYTGTEDYRWAILRGRMSPALFQVFNLLFIVLYQMTLLVLITLPALVAWEHPSPFGVWDAVFAVLFVAFLVGETVADQQQWDFHQRKARGRRDQPRHHRRRAAHPALPRLDGVHRVDLGGEVPRLRRVPAHDVDARPAPPPARQLSRPPEASR